MTNDAGNSQAITTDNAQTNLRTNDDTNNLTPDNLGFDIHDLARGMVTNNWFGQSMWAPETAEDYILTAAANPNIGNELSQAGLRFWKVAKFRYEVDRAREKFGRPPRKTIKPTD